MDRVECKIEETELENDSGREVDGVRATCNLCGHQTEAYGTGPRSVRRCLVLMREDCPEGSENFYVEEE